MQYRLEEEEEAKAALMSRIQRLTKLILVSSKNTIPGCLSDIPSHQMSHSVGEDDVSSFSLSILVMYMKAQIFLLVCSVFFPI
jgi:centromeric protein E